MPAPIDRTNQRFGRLLALCEVARDSRGMIWLCRCDCGAEVSIPARQLAGRKPVQSCGCLQREKAAKLGMASAKDRSGERTGRILILRRTDRRNGRSCYLCRCDCGTEFEATGSDLAPNRTQSCGCLQREMAAEANAARAKHGHTRKVDGNKRLTTPEYRSWKAMLERCRNQNAPNWHLYGGRGIKVCDRWQGHDGFAAFLADMGSRPQGSTLDRFPDNDGDYEPGNCRWADAKAQSNNRRATPELQAAREVNLTKGRKHWPRKEK